VRSRELHEVPEQVEELALRMQLLHERVAQVQRVQQVPEGLGVRVEWALQDLQVGLVLSQPQLRQHELEL